MAALEISFEFRTKRYKSAMKGLEAFGRVIDGSVEKIPHVLKEHLLRYLQSVANALAEKHSTPWQGGVKSTLPTLQRRSGFAMEQVKQSVRVDGNTIDTIRGMIGSGSAFYLRIQEKGGTITPKKAKYLTVPLPAALNSNGTPKKPSARDWENTFVAKSKAGNLIIFQKMGAKIIPLYVLKTSVKIPPRLGMEKALRGGIPYFVDTTVAAMLKEIMKDA